MHKRNLMPFVLVATGLLLSFSTSLAAPPPVPPAPGTAPAAPRSAPPAPSAASASPAELGNPAPDFTLPSLDGAPATLSKHKGKIVVLEWFNPECPFVRAAHNEGALKDMAAKHPEVVWLAINSGAAGKQGHDPEVNRKGKADFALTHPILFDADGQVGRRYGAERTPHMMIVDAAGNLVYRGGLDNSGSGRPSDAKPFINYVEEALKALSAGKPVPIPTTKAWGCSVKYSG